VVFHLIRPLLLVYSIDVELTDLTQYLLSYQIPQAGFSTTDSVDFYLSIRGGNIFA